VVVGAAAVVVGAAAVVIGAAAVVVVVDFEQLIRNIPAIKIIANDTKRSFFTLVPPLYDLVHLPIVR
jgi:hypothetical protein